MIFRGIVKTLSKMKLFRDGIFNCLYKQEKRVGVGGAGCIFVRNVADLSGYHLVLVSPANQVADKGIVRIDANQVPWQPGGKRVLATFYVGADEDVKRIVRSRQNRSAESERKKLSWLKVVHHNLRRPNATSFHLKSSNGKSGI
jgi:hypothetical protein